MLHRRLAPPLALVLIAGLTACSPAASPDPTPTYRQFASEEEAFEAAEETYRAYIAAMDAYYAGDVLADPLQYLTNGALTYEKEAQRFFEQERLRVEGASKISSFKTISAALLEGAAQVEATACLDSTGQRILDAAGHVQNEDRNRLSAQSLSFTSIEGEMRLYSIATVDGC